MNPELALSVGVLLGPAGLWMLQHPEHRSAAPELGERVALLEQFAIDRASAAATTEDGRM
jgi:hypothetical protein